MRRIAIWNRDQAVGFTLVELLVTITIIGIMATMFLAAMASTAETARTAATKATIAKINNLIMQRYEKYRTRRVPIPLVNSGNNASWPITAAGQRLDCLRELMRMELPESWLDITSPRQSSPPGGWGPLTAPSLWQAYNRKYNAIHPTQTAQGAECLYMICTTGVSDELDNLEQFRQSEIADTDGDGAPEFVDAWGTPIYFIRWAPGFVSELQTHQDPDPFDPRHVYPSVSGASGAASSVYSPTGTQTTKTYALYPLVFSAGPDKLYGIVKPVTTAYATNNNNPFYTCLPASGTPYPNGTPQDVESGATTTINVIDNIHNHLLGTK